MTLTALPGTANAVRLSTEEAAARLKIKPQTLRAALCRDGHYCGLRPVKAANRFLYWPADAVERLTDLWPGQRGKPAMQQLSFLPAPPLCAIWPEVGSLTRRALDMLLQGRAIDHPSFQHETESWRLAAYVRELRALGWPVEASEAPAPIPENPRRHIARYRLPQEAIKAVDDERR